MEDSSRDRKPEKPSVRRMSPRPGASTVAVIKPACLRCNDHGWLRKDVPVGHPDFGEVFCCPCKTPDATRRLQQISGLSEAELLRHLDDIETEGRPGTALMVGACRAFVARPTGILSIWGGVGNGKTMTLQAVVNELVAKGTAAVYITAFDLLGHLTEAFDGPRAEHVESAYKRLLRFARVPVLAIDEFDKRTDTKWVNTQMGDLIEKRYRLGEADKGGTVIAMNSDPALQPAWIASRLLDGRNRVVHNEDSDIRPALER